MNGVLIRTLLKGGKYKTSTLSRLVSTFIGLPRRLWMNWKNEYSCRINATFFCLKSYSVPHKWSHWPRAKQSPEMWSIIRETDCVLHITLLVHYHPLYTPFHFQRFEFCVSSHSSHWNASFTLFPLLYFLIYLNIFPLNRLLALVINIWKV